MGIQLQPGVLGMPYIEKEKVAKLLGELGHRLVDVPGPYGIASGSLVIILPDTEKIIEYSTDMVN